MQGFPDRQINATALARLVRSRPVDGRSYTRVAEAVRRSVLDGSLPLGTRVPSERELAAALGVSRTTTAAAYQRLREQGFLVTRRGSGSVTTTPRGPQAPAVGMVVASDVADDGVVDLTMAAPGAPVELHEAAVRALEALPRLLAGTGYTYLGLPELRTVIADRYTRRGTPTAPDEVLVTSGAQQATSLLLDSLVGPGDRVVVEHPGYPNALSAVRATGARAVPVPVGRHGLDLDLLESTIRQVAPRVVLFTPDHHNPTGTSLDDAGRARVREMALRHRTLVVADETLTELTLEGAAPASVTGPTTLAGLATIGSASKTFWGGLRIGWIRAHRDVVARLAHERARDDISSAVLDQLIATDLLARADEVLPERRRALREQRDALLDAVARLLPWRVAVPAGGMSCWADLGAPVSSTLAALAPRHGVRVVAGPAFGVDGSFDDRLRLTFTQAPDRLVTGVERLAAAWADLGRPTGPAVPGPTADRVPSDLVGATGPVV